MNLENSVSFIRSSAAVAAGTTLVTGDAVDMAGYEGCFFMIPIGAIVSGAVTSAKLQQSSDNASADAYADIAGSAVTIADDDDGGMAIIHIYRPRERYLKALVSRATQNAVVDGIIALRYGARKLPATDDATTVIEHIKLTSPAEGTA
jgi:hypothetical protein